MLRLLAVVERLSDLDIHLPILKYSLEIKKVQYFQKQHERGLDWNFGARKNDLCFGIR